LTFIAGKLSLVGQHRYSKILLHFSVNYQTRKFLKEAIPKSKS